MRAARATAGSSRGWARYNPLLAAEDEKRVVLNEERIRYWLGQGAQVSDRVARFLDKAGILPGATRHRGTGKRAAEIAKQEGRGREGGLSLPKAMPAMRGPADCVCVAAVGAAARRAWRP